jgi:hypothetical protein
VSELPNGVVSMVIAKCKGEVYESVCTGGSMFLLYEIMMQSLLASESVLEFMARSLDYFKSQVGILYYFRFLAIIFLTHVLLFIPYPFVVRFIRGCHTERKRTFFEKVQRKLI